MYSLLASLLNGIFKVSLFGLVISMYIGVIKSQAYLPIVIMVGLGIILGLVEYQKCVKKRKEMVDAFDGLQEALRKDHEEIEKSLHEGNRD